MSGRAGPGPGIGAWNRGTDGPPLSFCLRRERRDGTKKIYGLYEQVSYNCFIAAGLYVLLGGFSFCQVRLNKRKEYMVR